MAGDVSFEQLTEGLFPAPSAFGAAGTPSMVISFADCSGVFDICSGEATGSVSVNVGGTIPAADGFADVAQSGLTRTPGVNNFRIFVLGNGPDLRPAAGGTAVVPGTPSTLLKVDMQIDLHGLFGVVGEPEKHGVCDIGRDTGGDREESESDAGRSAVLRRTCAQRTGVRTLWIFVGIRCRIHRPRVGT